MADKKLKYIATIDSVSQHEVPEWFHDAEFAIFIHWGLYSISVYASVGFNYPDDIRKKGFDVYLKNNPYAEWYLNTLRIEESPTQKYNYETFGEDFEYDDFIPIFNDAIKKWDPGE